MSRDSTGAHGRRQFALVTGGCSGIGKAIAHRLAARGYALILVSERPGPLEAAAASIRTLFGREMRERRSGRILLVSSISAWGDFPGIACYGSSKKYLRGFARALRSEMQVHGVTVTCLAPGPTATGLYGLDSVAVRRGRRLGLAPLRRSRRVAFGLGHRSLEQVPRPRGRERVGALSHLRGRFRNLRGPGRRGPRKRLKSTACGC